MHSAIVPPRHGISHATTPACLLDCTFYVLLRCPAASLALKSLPHLPTAATRSGRFLCHRQRSHRSPTYNKMPEAVWLQAFLLFIN